MKLEISVPEMKELIKKISNPESFLEAMRFDVREAVGDFLSKLMSCELTEFLGRQPYERKVFASTQVEQRTGAVNKPSTNSRQV
ncbi:MAG: hypothetical protein QNL04_05375 [SAR324 cluster bacterium]|nr:hypothetical protein [SAR324 cluster bacterium]